jgi:riboflavin synthase
LFTGLIQAVGAVRLRAESRLGIGFDTDALGPIALGDSIAVNGVCLTAVHFSATEVHFDVSPETWARTHLGTLEVGNTVNLEPSLTPSSKLGGHFVSGHVDAVGAVLAIDEEPASQRWRFSLPAIIAPLVAVKGCIAVDGVSLTVNEVGEDWFGVTLIPHTLEHTRFHQLMPGAPVNLEADMLARYAARALQFAAVAP